MLPEALCENLLNAVEGEERGRLVTEAIASPECLDYLLASSRDRIAADPVDAERRAALAVILAELRNDLPAAANAWRLRARSYRGQGLHAEAETALLTASESAARAGDPLLAARARIGRVDSLGWLGRYDEAVALALRLEAELLALSAREDAAKVLVNLGSLHYRRDQYRPALECYERALAVLVQLGEPVAVARILANTANVLTELNRVDEALALFEQARGAFEQSGQTTATAMVDANIGFLHYASSKYGAAIAALSRARKEFTERGQLLEAAKCDADAAEAYRELNLYPEALEAYDSAIRHFEGASIDYERARAETGRASVLANLGRSDEAMQGLERAEALFRGHKNSVRVAHARLMRAYLHRAAGRTTEAVSDARSAAATFSRHRLRGWAAEARFLVAEAALLSGAGGARGMLAVSREARAHGRGWLEARAGAALGRFHSVRRANARSLRHYRAGAAALETARGLVAPEEMHVAFLRDKIAVYEEFVGALLHSGRPQDIAEALETVERAKSRLLLERVQAALDGRAAAGAVSSDVETRLAALRAELSRAYHRLHALDQGETRRLGAACPPEAESLARLERVYHAALQDADLAGLTSGDAVAPLPEIVASHALQARLEQDEALIEFYIIDESVSAFVLTRRRIRVFRDIASVKDIAFQARRLRYQLQRVGGGGDAEQRHAHRHNADTRAVLEQLYDLLIQPLENALTVERLVLIPFSSLHGLPFHAFHDGMRYALERWEIVYAPSAAVWHESLTRRKRTRGPGQERALLVGVPDPGIEKVTEEVDRLAALLPSSQVLRGDDANLKSFREFAPGSRLIHLASHGLYRSDNPLFSGLRFADGWLLARDLYSMRLTCDLVTLSACQTGMAFVEAGDELFGLQRGFLAAGAKSVVASLWLADDSATAKLMEQFYTGMSNGMSKAAALRAAQRRILCRLPHPYHWAAFVLIGER